MTSRAIVLLMDTPCGTFPLRARATRGTSSPVRSSISIRNARSAEIVSNARDTRVRLGQRHLLFHRLLHVEPHASEEQNVSVGNLAAGDRLTIPVRAQTAAQVQHEAAGRPDHELGALPRNGRVLDDEVARR